MPSPPSVLEVFFNLFDEDESSGSDARRFAALCRSILHREGHGGRWEINLALVSDDELRALHAQFMGDDSVTDVMTFPAGEPDRGGGDIVVSVDRAAAQGQEHGHSTAEEVDFLFVHGLLHLCGWDDRDPAARHQMLERQTLLLQEFRRNEGSTGVSSRHD